MMSAPAWKRIAVDKRSWLVPLAIAMLLNIGVYVLVVYPLGVKSAGAANRAKAAAAALKAAADDHAAARALVSGKSRAEQELTTFYGKVLPRDFDAAMRLMYLPVPSAAKRANVRIIGRRFDMTALGKDGRLGRVHISASLQGDYESFRQFIYELETSPEFVIIDDVGIAQGDVNKPLTVTLELSTYYPLSAHGN